jgi:hypothetical protein
VPFTPTQCHDQHARRLQVEHRGQPSTVVRGTTRPVVCWAEIRAAGWAAVRPVSRRAAGAEDEEDIRKVATATGRALLRLVGLSAPTERHKSHGSAGFTPATSYFVHRLPTPAGRDASTDNREDRPETTTAGPGVARFAELETAQRPRSDACAWPASGCFGPQVCMNADVGVATPSRCCDPKTVSEYHPNHPERERSG